MPGDFPQTPQDSILTLKVLETIRVVSERNASCVSPRNQKGHGEARWIVYDLVRYREIVEKKERALDDDSKYMIPGGDFSSSRINLFLDEAIHSFLCVCVCVSDFLPEHDDVCFWS